MLTGSNRSFSMIISRLGEGKTRGCCLYVHYDSQNVSGLMFKKKLLTLLTELVVILNHLGIKSL